MPPAARRATRIPPPGPLARHDEDRRAVVQRHEGGLPGLRRCPTDRHRRTERGRAVGAHGVAQRLGLVGAGTPREHRCTRSTCCEQHLGRVGVLGVERRAGHPAGHVPAPAGTADRDAHGSDAVRARAGRRAELSSGVPSTGRDRIDVRMTVRVCWSDVRESAGTSCVHSAVADPLTGSMAAATPRMPPNGPICSGSVNPGPSARAAAAMVIAMTHVANPTSRVRMLAVNGARRRWLRSSPPSYDSYVQGHRCHVIDACACCCSTR